MGKQVLQAVLILALPTIALVTGGWAMMQVSGRESKSVKQPLSEAEKAARKPLGRRVTYDKDAVSQHWKALGDDNALDAEQRFLQLDLVFPIFYAAALAFSLVLAWESLGRPFNLAWIIVPVTLALLADWVENLAQLNQLGKYSVMGAKGLQPDLIRVASTATLLKWIFVGGTSIMLLVLVGIKLVRAAKSG